MYLKNATWRWCESTCQYHDLFADLDPCDLSPWPTWLLIIVQWISVQSQTGGQTDAKRCIRAHRALAQVDSKIYQNDQMNLKHHYLLDIIHLRAIFIDSTYKASSFMGWCTLFISELLLHGFISELQNFISYHKGFRECLELLLGNAVNINRMKDLSFDKRYISIRF